MGARRRPRAARRRVPLARCQRWPDVPLAHRPQALRCRGTTVPRRRWTDMPLAHRPSALRCQGITVPGHYGVPHRRLSEASCFNSLSEPPLPDRGEHEVNHTACRSDVDNTETAPEAYIRTCRQRRFVCVPFQSVLGERRLRGSVCVCTHSWACSYKVPGFLDDGFAGAPRCLPGEPHEAAMQSGVDWRRYGSVLASTTVP